MPSPLSGDKYKWPLRYLTPGKDFLLREELTEEKAKRMTIGSAHETPSAYPNFKLCAFEPIPRKRRRPAPSYGIVSPTRVDGKTANRRCEQINQHVLDRIRQVPPALVILSAYHYEWGYRTGGN